MREQRFVLPLNDNCVIVNMIQFLAFSKESLLISSISSSSSISVSTSRCKEQHQQQSQNVQLRRQMTLLKIQPGYIVKLFRAGRARSGRTSLSLWCRTPVDNKETRQRGKRGRGWIVGKDVPWMDRRTPEKLCFPSRQLKCVGERAQEGPMSTLLLLCCRINNDANSRRPLLPVDCP